MMVTLGAAVRTELINDLWRGELKEMGKEKTAEKSFAVRKPGHSGQLCPQH